jgi:DNA replication and repair protein RecF
VRLRRIELTDVRSYERADLTLASGVTLLVGPNGQGKTNLLEALHRTGTGSSHRVASDGPLVRSGAQLGVVRCELETDDGRRRTVEVELAAGRRTRTRVDGQDVRRAADAVGVLRTVLFAPEDVAIVRGDPDQRRRFLDDLLTQRRPAYGAARGEYERVLRQRNQLLKQLRGLPVSARDTATATLTAWTEQLVVHGTQLVAARLAAVRTLAGPIDRAYRDLADQPETVGVVYRSTVGDLAAEPDGPVVPDPEPIAAAFRRALETAGDEEVARGVSLVGPHRDDVELSIGALTARQHASQGEAWSLALALKLATFDLLAEVGDRPVVLLDDVFAELDTTRRARLAAACEAFDQVLVTGAVEADIPLAGQRVDVVMVDGATRLVPRADGTAGVA